MVSQIKRFTAEGYQEQYSAVVKSLTSKPVVGVGRYTSPDHMVSLVKNGVLDFIGAELTTKVRALHIVFRLNSSR